MKRKAEMEGNSKLFQTGNTINVTFNHVTIRGLSSSTNGLKK